MLFLGNDWAEAHHDIELVDEAGRRLARRRLPEGVEELAALHALIADHLADDAEPAGVVVGIETDRGPWVSAPIAAGYTLYAINPRQVARYRERHGSAGAKSDSGDAHVLAEWSASTAPTTAGWPGTRRWPNTSRCSPARTSR